MPSLFRRRTDAPAEPAGDEPATAPSGSETGSESDSGAGSGAAAPRAGVKPKSYTPGKGRPTPKRRSNRQRRAEPPPQSRREAYQRTRERQRQERREARAAMMRGDERYLPERDRGPERTLTRSIVDARRNVGSYFFGAAIVIVVLGALPVPDPVRVAVNGFWLVTLVAIVVDSVLLCRLVKRLVLERHPKTTIRFGGLYFYAVTRALTLRRMRIPAAQVKPGDEI